MPSTTAYGQGMGLVTVINKKQPSDQQSLLRIVKHGHDCRGQTTCSQAQGKDPQIFQIWPEVKHLTPDLWDETPYSTVGYALLF